MKKRKKTGGRDFQPGQSGNPKGRPPLPGDLKSAKHLNKIEFERVLNELMWEKSAGDLDSVLLDQSLPPVYHVVARVLLESIERGDAIRLDFLLNRLIGKVQDKVEITVPKPTIIKRSDGSELELGAAYEERDDTHED